MALSGELARFTYSGATAHIFPQGDPLLSLGGLSPDDFPDSQLPLSAPYAQASLDAVSPALNQLSASTPDSGESRVPAVDDWVMVVTGAAAPAFGKIKAINSGVLTLDRELPNLTAASDFIRSSKVENIFPDVTLAQVSDGLIDHRMLYFYQNGGGTEGDFKFWIEPLTPSAATIEIIAGGDNLATGSLPLLATGTDNPFNEFSKPNLLNPTLLWEFSEKPRIRYSSSQATPGADTDVFVANGNTPIWLRRTVPVGAAGSKCVFALLVRSAADPSSDPDPFATGFIFEFEVPDLTYTITLDIDRTVYINGDARVTATVKDQFGQFAVGLNAWIELFSGPGSVVTDLDGLTDADGQLKTIYTAPTVVTVDPVLRVVIPTSPEV